MHASKLEMIRKLEAREAAEAKTLLLRKKLAAAQVAASAGDQEAAKTVILLKRALNFV